LRIFDACVSPLQKFIGEMNTRNIERNQRLDALEARVAELEQRPSLKYIGVWREGEDYVAGDAVTDHGSLWIARVNHIKSRPGTDGIGGWQLAVKKGRDAR
jgi:hypothetical protein